MPSHPHQGFVERTLQEFSVLGWTHHFGCQHLQSSSASAFIPKPLYLRDRRPLLFFYSTELKVLALLQGKNQVYDSVL